MALIQSNHVNSSSSILLPSPPTPGNTVIVGFASTAGSTPSAVHDSNSNNYIKVVSGALDVANNIGAIWYFVATSNAARQIISTGATNRSMWAAEFSNINSVTPVETFATSGTGNSGTTINLPSMPVASSGDLIIAVVGSTSISNTYTINSPYADLGSGNIGYLYDMEYYTEPGSLTFVNPNVTISASDSWGAVMAAFLQIANPGPPNPQYDWPLPQNPEPDPRRSWSWRQVDKFGLDILPTRQQYWPNPPPINWDKFSAFPSPLYTITTFPPNPTPAPPVKSLGIESFTHWKDRGMGRRKYIRNSWAVKR